MKKAIVTRSDNNIREMKDLTHPIIQRYADRVGADFIELNHDAPVHKYHYRILRCADLLDEYDRILSLDTDTLVSPSCPDLFKFVPEDCIGSVYEDKGSRKMARLKLIYEIQQYCPDVGWTEGYVNTGVFIFSKQHKDIFNVISQLAEKYWDGWGYDDVHLGYNVHKYGFKIKELNYRFNNMTMFCEAWNGSPSRFDSNIIHYAGVGRFIPKCRSRIQQIQHDKGKWYPDG